MNLVKSIDFFDPVLVKGKCHIIGCGSVGSTLAELLARLGITNFVLYDFDTIESRNIANQMFFESDIGLAKVKVTERLIKSINSEANIQTYDKGYSNQRLSGYVFLAVDNIDLRRKIVEDNKFNQSIKGMFDLRTRLTDAQSYAADWGNLKQVENLLKTMQFSHEEAHAATPVTACNVEMGVAPTVRLISNLCVTNFMNFVLGKGLKNIILCDAFAMEIETY